MSVQTSWGPAFPECECTTPVVEKVVGSLKASSEGRYPVAMTGERVLERYRRWRDGIAGTGGDGRGCSESGVEQNAGLGTTHCGAAQPHSSEQVEVF